MGGLEYGKKAFLIAFKRKSIANRWLVNSFCVIAGILVLLNIGVFLLTKLYCYGAVRQYLSSEANAVMRIILYDYRSDDEAANTNNIRRAVESFALKHRMELMAIDTAGDIAYMSSGFTPIKEDMPDVQLAIASPEGFGTHIGWLQNGEKYLAVTLRLGDEIGNGGYSAIRVVTSLRRLDNAISLILIFCVIVSVMLLTMVLSLGLYFIRSIVVPLREIGRAAGRLAQGDFSNRIDLSYQKTDEISELCGIFNQMADELQASERMKNDFISSVSHELRTPLTAIKGWSETIYSIIGCDDALSKTTMEKGMRVISQETERLSGMVEELLDFSRLENGQFALQMANTDLLAELTDAILIYTERARQEDIIIAYEEPEDILLVYGDKNRLRQVFINVLDNAIKYSSKGSIVNVEIEKQDKQVVVRIADHGAGIAKADLPKIKTRFYKANHTVRGSGIGLAVADEIITRHDGTLEIDSELNKGTVVTICLPLLKTSGNM